MSDSRPIGVFDSGIGGLTVVKALRELLPNEDIFYLGDTARLPYGNKSAETVERYSLELADMLIREKAKLIVVACNTVSSVSMIHPVNLLPGLTSSTTTTPTVSFLSWTMNCVAISTPARVFCR